MVVASPNQFPGIVVSKTLSIYLAVIMVGNISLDELEQEAAEAEKLAMEAQKRAQDLRELAQRVRANSWSGSMDNDN